MSYGVEPGASVDVEAVLNHNETTASVNDFGAGWMNTKKPDFELVVPQAVTDAGVTASELATEGTYSPATISRSGWTREMTWNAKTTLTVPANYLDFEHPNPIEGQIVASKKPEPGAGMTVKSRATVKAIYPFEILVAAPAWVDLHHTPSTGTPAIQRYYSHQIEATVSSCEEAAPGLQTAIDGMLAMTTWSSGYLYARQFNFNNDSMAGHCDYWAIGGVRHWNTSAHAGKTATQIKLPTNIGDREYGFFASDEYEPTLTYAQLKGSFISGPATRGDALILSEPLLLKTYLIATCFPKAPESDPATGDCWSNIQWGSFGGSGYPNYYVASLLI